MERAAEREPARAWRRGGCGAGELIGEEVGEGWWVWYSSNASFYELGPTCQTWTMGTAYDSGRSRGVENGTWGIDGTEGTYELGIVEVCHILAPVKGGFSGKTLHPEY